jgi:hypothetical protein
LSDQPNRSGDQVTRRTVVAGAAAGTLALASDPALAQRLPAPSPRAKGPLVWLDRETLANPYGFMGRAALEMISLAT